MTRSKLTRQIRFITVLLYDLDLLWTCGAVRLHYFTAGPAGTGSHHGLFGLHFTHLAGINYPCLIKQCQGSVIGSTSPIPATQLFEQLLLLLMVAIVVVVAGLQL
jgi:hypothetical protein